MPRKNRYTQRKDGRFYTQVNTGEYDDYGRPIRIPLYGATSAELEKKVDALKVQIRAGKYIVPKRLTFEEYVRTWYATYKVFRPDQINTKEMYDYIIDGHLLPEFGTLEIDKIKRTDIQILINKNFDHPRACEQIKMVLKQILSSAVDDHVIEFSPWVKINMPQSQKPKRRTLTELEKQAINKADLSLMEHTLLLLLYGCGLRREEALALHVGDIDMDKGDAIIRHAIVFDVNQPYLKESPKTVNGFRRVPIPAFMLDSIRFYVGYICRGKQPAECGSLPLFTTARGGLVSKSCYDRMWARIIKKLNAAMATKDNPQPIAGLTSRVFRYNYATMLYYSEISIKQAVEYMGHADEKMIIEVYAQLDEKKENAREKINSISLLPVEKEAPELRIIKTS